MKCKYEGCEREAMENSEYCVLHVPFDGKTMKEIIMLARLKQEQFLKEIDEGKTNFRGVALCHINLENKTLKNVNFSGATFKGIIFKNVKFKNISFEGAKFRDFISFIDCKFKGNIDFSGCEFSLVEFRSCRFENVEFYNTCFEGDLLLEDVKFKGSVKFRGVKFKNSVIFRDCIFNGKTEFKILSTEDNILCTEFNDVVLFQDCTFFNDLEFAGVDFKSDTRFIRCKFAKRVLFIDVSVTEQDEVKEVICIQFGSNGERMRFEFYDCIFQDLFGICNPKIGENTELNFAYSEFEKSEKVEFRNVDLSEASFLYVQGLEGVRFTNVTWNRTGRFIKRFCIHDEILLRRGKIEKVLKNIRENLDEHNKFEQEMKIMEALAQTYRQLRMAYESMLLYPEAGDFYIGEMEMKRLNAVFRKKPVKNKFLRFLIRNFSLTAFYKYLSYYGECYWLPLFWMLLTILVFSGLYHNYYGLNWHQALENSAAILFQMPPQKIKVPFLVIVFERLLGLVFTALFVLALKRKFKKP